MLQLPHPLHGPVVHGPLVGVGVGVGVGAQGDVFLHDVLVDGRVDGSQFPLLQLTLTGWVPQPPPHEPEQLPYADADHVPVYVGAAGVKRTFDTVREPLLQLTSPYKDPAGELLLQLAELLPPLTIKLTFALQLAPDALNVTLPAGQLDGGHTALFTQGWLASGFVAGSQSVLLQLTLRDCVPV